MAVRDACFDAGLLINSPRPELLRFMPPLTLSRREVDEMLGMLEPALVAALRG